MPKTTEGDSMFDLDLRIVPGAADTSATRSAFTTVSAPREIRNKTTVSAPAQR